MLSGLFRRLVGGSVHVDWCWWDDGEKGLEKEIGALGVEVHRQRCIELCCWYAEGNNGDSDGGAGDFWGRVCDGAEWWEVGAVSGEDDVVGWVEGDLVTAVGSGVTGLGRVDGEHVRGHLGREIVDHDGELLGESWR